MSEAKRAFSLVWDHFTLVDPRKVQCSLCSQCLSFNKNTSAMLRHLRSRHPSEAWYNTCNPSSGVLAMLPNAAIHSSFSNGSGILPTFSSSSGTFPTFSSTTAGLGPLLSSTTVPTLSPSSVTTQSALAFSTRQEDLDDALFNMLIKDCQPFSLVEDEGFAAFVQKLDPEYVLPAKQALKARALSQIDATKDGVASEVERADYVSLTSDTWMSADKDTYISVTGHLVTEASRLCTFLLGVSRLPENHKAAHQEEARNQLVAGWGLHSKVAAFVTDAGDSSMATTVHKLGVLQLPSFAHVLNQVVKRSMEATAELQVIRSKARTIVAFFKSSPMAKERLAAVQEQLNRPGQKLLLEVESRWNSSFSMLQRLFHQREAVAAALSTLDTDISPLGSADYDVIHQCLGVLDPFHQATAELSSERRVSASKVIPLVRMLRIILEKKSSSPPCHPAAAQLACHLQRALQASCGGVEMEPVLALATLLDPQFKVLAFGSPASAQEPVKLLTSECAALIRVPGSEEAAAPYSSSSPPPRPSASSGPASPLPASSSSASSRVQGGGAGGGLWEMFDSKVGETQSVQSSTADAAVEVQRYLSDAYLHRGENPLHYWERHCKVYPHLFHLARKYLSVPASAVPCRSLFTKAGDVFSKRRSCLSMNAVEQVMLLNEGLV